MYYEKQARILFEQAIECLEALKVKGSVSIVETTMLCLLCKKFEDNFERWLSCVATSDEDLRAAASTYQEYIKSTPLNEMLELSHGKRFSWIKEYLTRIKEHH